MRGSIEAVGNQLLTCPALSTGCTNARNRTGAVATMNNNYTWCTSTSTATAPRSNSSTATLTLPAGATVTWAGLYWGADTSDRRDRRLGRAERRQPRRHQAGGAGAEEERSREQREAAHELEGAVRRGGRCCGSWSTRVAGRGAGYL